MKLNMPSLYAAQHFSFWLLISYSAFAQFLLCKAATVMVTLGRKAKRYIFVGYFLLNGKYEYLKCTH